MQQEISGSRRHLFGLTCPLTWPLFQTIQMLMFKLIKHRFIWFSELSLGRKTASPLRKQEQRSSLGDGGERTKESKQIPRSALAEKEARNSRAHEFVARFALWGVITAKIKFGILLRCFPMWFLIFSLVFLMFSMMFAKTSLLFCYFCIRLFQPRCYYSCPYAVMRNLDAIIRVSNYVRLNPGLQRARPQWSGASDKFIMPILPAERKFMLLSMAEFARKMSSNN